MPSDAVYHPYTQPQQTGERANFGIRFAGWILDQIFNTIGSFVIAFVVALLVIAGSGGDSEGAVAPLYLLTSAGVLVYRWVADSLGGTLGKRAVGIRVVDERTGDVPGFGSGFIRTLVSIGSGLALGLGYLWAAWDDKGQTWHDKAAGTLVVRK